MGYENLYQNRSVKDLTSNYETHKIVVGFEFQSQGGGCSQTHVNTLLSLLDPTSIFQYFDASVPRYGVCQGNKATRCLMVIYTTE